MKTARETFRSRAGVVLTTIGVAVGLGNVWRFPYMTGRFGGAAFVLLYVLVTVAIGVPALMAELALGRHTRRGTVGAFEISGLPAGRAIGWSLFIVVIAATAYYTNVIGWVLWHALAHALDAAGLNLDAAAILPPGTGFSAKSLLLQMFCTVFVIVGCACVLVAGVRRGIERVSRLVTPLIFLSLLVLIARGVSLPGARGGIDWFILKFSPSDLDAGVMVAAMGQAIFSLSLGGTFMVVYGSYLGDVIDLRSTAIWTAAGDLLAGLLAGLAIFPAVFAFGIEPGGGPTLLFETLPLTFERMPGGPLFGLVFFAGLAGAAFLSDVAAFEVLVAGLVDNSALDRRRAVALMACAVFLLSIPPMINMNIFVPWDLTFGSGMQTLGALLSVLAVGWCMDRASALDELSKGGTRIHPALVVWLRYAVPLAILTAGAWWIVQELLGP